jgi:hypothetical protein
MERSVTFAHSRVGMKRSKRWGCRSKKLTPTPEPAGYCAGDVRIRGSSSFAPYDAVNRGGWDEAFRDARPDFELVTPDQNPIAGLPRARRDPWLFR